MRPRGVHFSRRHRRVRQGWGRGAARPSPRRSDGRL